MYQLLTARGLWTRSPLCCVLVELEIRPQSSLQIDPLDIFCYGRCGDLTRTYFGGIFQNLTSLVEFETAFNMLLTFSNRAPRKQLGRPTIHGPRATNVTEIGPQSALQGPINHMLQAFQGAKKPSYVASLDRGQDASASLLRAIGRVYCSGYPVDILRVNSLDRETPRPPPPKMPRYPFNHEKKYWRESLLSHNFRSQSARRHDLLGVRSIDWNPQVAQWRHILRLGEMPWLRDHKIAGEIVFPGAGYVVMAVESLKQLVERSVAVKGICLQEVASLHPIRFIQGAEQVETQLTISSPNLVSGNSVLLQFRIFVYENGSYLECASGLIGAVVDAKRRDQIICIGPWNSNDWFQRISSSC